MTGRLALCAFVFIGFTSSLLAQGPVEIWQKQFEDVEKFAGDYLAAFRANKFLPAMPATWSEETKAAAFSRILHEMGLSVAHVASAGNVLAVRIPEKLGDRLGLVLVAAKLDKNGVLKFEQKRLNELAALDQEDVQRRLQEKLKADANISRLEKELFKLQQQKPKAGELGPQVKLASVQRNLAGARRNAVIAEETLKVSSLSGAELEMAKQALALAEKLKPTDFDELTRVHARVDTLVRRADLLSSQLLKDEKVMDDETSESIKRVRDLRAELQKAEKAVDPGRVMSAARALKKAHDEALGRVKTIKSKK